MIITLCGSARFETAYVYWNELLTYEGHTVFSLSVFPSQKGRKDWYDPMRKDLLDKAHFRKIDASDAIFVITREQPFTRETPYIGESTANEIRHAALHNKKFFSDVWSCPEQPCGSAHRLYALGGCDQCRQGGFARDVAGT